MSLRISRARRELIPEQPTTSAFSSIPDGSSMSDRVLAKPPIPAYLRQIVAVLATALASILFPLVALLPLTDILRLLLSVML
jgi:hypothetical protein